MRKLKLSGVKIRNRSRRFIINFGQGSIYWALMTELQVILDVGCIMSKMCTQPSTPQPVLSPVLSQSFLLSPLSSGWAGSWCSPQLSITYTKRLQVAVYRKDWLQGTWQFHASAAVVRVAKVKKKWESCLRWGRINWYNQVGRTCFIIKAKDAFTVLQCNNSTSPCIQETPLKS